MEKTSDKAVEKKGDYVVVNKEHGLPRIQNKPPFTLEKTTKFETWSDIIKHELRSCEYEYLVNREPRTAETECGRDGRRTQKRFYCYIFVD